jgi:hypothetical protein
VDAGPVQSLGRVNVAQTCHPRLIEQKGFDRLAAGAKHATERFDREVARQRLKTQRFEAAHLGLPEHLEKPEAPGVDEKKPAAGPEVERHPNRRRRGLVPTPENELAGHPQVGQEAAFGTEVPHQVFAAAIDVPHSRASHHGSELGGTLSHQNARVEDACVADHPAAKPGLEILPGDLDLRQLGQRIA